MSSEVACPRCLLFLLAVLLGCGDGAGPSNAFRQPLTVPPVLAPTSGAGGVLQFDLTAHQGVTAFLPGQGTSTYGYNGLTYLGPTLRLTRGQATRITLHNGLLPDVAPPMSTPALAMNLSGLSNGTSLHLHGLISASSADLAPNSCCLLLPTGAEVSTSVFVPEQPSAMLWYHPHPFADTGRQVYLGLAGLLILDDPADAGLGLPHTYGVDDLPLIVQDRRFNADGSFQYRTLAQDMDGVLGDHILVNGVIAPYANVPATRLRLRLLNASNRRGYLFALDDGRPFLQIGTDGGLLPAPAPVAQVPLQPGERADLLVDFSADGGRTPTLVSRAFRLPPKPGRAPHGPGPGSTLVDGVACAILQFRVGAPAPSTPPPPVLATLPPLDTAPVTVTRRFDLELNSDNTINGLLFNMNRIDLTVKAGATELWTVTNHTPDLAHPWHVHGIQFRVLDRSTGPLEPNDQGWKDTVRVMPGETIRMLMPFDPGLAGTYMFHCHNLEHEDMGMMGQFAVQP